MTKEHHGPLASLVGGTFKLTQDTHPRKLLRRRREQCIAMGMRIKERGAGNHFIRGIQHSPPLSSISLVVSRHRMIFSIEILDRYHS